MTLYSPFGHLDARQTFRLAGTNTIALSAAKNDWAPSGTINWADTNFLRVNCTVGAAVTGFASGTDENAGSSAANQIDTGFSGNDLVVRRDECLLLFYDDTAQRWRILSWLNDRNEIGGAYDYGQSATNPASPTPTNGSRYFNTTVNRPAVYNSTLGKWVGMAPTPYPFGHSGSGLGTSTRLRCVGLASDADAAYEQPFDQVLIGYGYARSDSDSSEFEVMVNASTIKSTIATAATRGSSMALNVDIDANDELWARVGASAANSMNPRTLTLYCLEKFT